VGISGVESASLFGRRERFLIWASRSLLYGSARWRGRERQIARQGERHRMGTGARRRTHTEECVAPSGDEQFQIGTERVSKFRAAVGDEARRSRRATGRHIDRAKGETSSRHLRPAIWQGPPALIEGVRERQGPRATPAHRARAPCGRAGDMCASSQRHDTGTGRVTMTMSNVRPHRIEMERLFCIKVSSSTMVNWRTGQEIRLTCYEGTSRRDREC